MNANGRIVWEGHSPIDGAPIVVIVTGLTDDSDNSKTGAMIQTWIMRRDVNPWAAVNTGQDESVCGACPHRGIVVDGRALERACYVKVWQAPNAIWGAYSRGSYESVTPLEAAGLVAGRDVRIGSYGDPGMVPLSVWRALVAHAGVVTGYTHQWRNIDPAYAGLLMASTDTVEDRRDARQLGYRCFYVGALGESKPDGAMLCSAVRDRNPLQCADCGACGGTRDGASVGAVDVFIEAHGSGKKYVAKQLVTR